MAKLTVMTWNVQNMLPVGHDDGPATDAEYDAKLAAIAAVIDQVEPDVVGFQEVGPESVLADLNAHCATDFDHRLVGVPDGRGIRVALMSPRRLSNRLDITTYPAGVLPVQSRDLAFDNPATAENEAQSAALGRGVLSATVRSGDAKVTVIVAHLKSKLISYARQPGVVEGNMFAPHGEGERLRYAGYAQYRRTAEAMTCRAGLDAILAADGNAAGDGPATGTNTPVIFMGDLKIIQGPGGSENDEPQAATTQIDFRPNSGFQQGDAGDGWRMWNLYRLLPPEGPNYTRIYRGRGELIDHIFASHRLVNPDNLPTVEVVAAAPLPSMDDQPAPATALPSDHAAVVANFEV